MTRPSRFAAAALVAAGLLAPLAAEAAGTRTHVSNAGSDANTAFSCDYAHPCRTFAAALTVTTPGGEILAIDSSGYGKLVIDRSVSIIAAPGVFAGIGVGAGGNATGVEIATPGVDVVLRGLAITGQGGTYGINMSNGATLSVENCVISGFAISGGAGIHIDTDAQVRIVDSTLRSNDAGLKARNGTVNIAGSRFLGNSLVGIGGHAAAGANAYITVSDAIVADGNYGIISESTTTGHIKVAVTRSTVSNGNYGLYANKLATGTARLTVSNSLVYKNTWGLVAQGGAVLNSLGNNPVQDNTNPTGGSITTVPLI